MFKPINDTINSIKPTFKKIGSNIADYTKKSIQRIENTKGKAPAFTSVMEDLAAKVPAIRKVAEYQPPSWTNALGPLPMGLNLVKNAVLGDPKHTDYLNNINEKLFSGQSLTPQEEKDRMKSSMAFVMGMTGDLNNTGIPKPRTFSKVPEVPSAVPEFPQVPTQVTQPQQVVDPLIAEARKYGNIDEYINTYNKYFRGQNTDYAPKGVLTPNAEVGAIYGTKDRSVAQEFGNDILDMYVKPTKTKEALNRTELAKEIFNLPSNVADEEDVLSALGKKFYSPYNPYDEVEKLIINKLKEQGFDSIQYIDQTMGVPEIVMFNPKNAYNKSQLTDIYNQANPQVTLENRLKNAYPSGGFTDTKKSIMTSDGTIVNLKGEDAHYNFFGGKEVFNKYLDEGGIRINNSSLSSKYPSISIEVNSEPTPRQILSLKNLPEDRSIIYDIRGGKGGSISSDIMTETKQDFLNFLAIKYPESFRKLGNVPVFKKK